jgi:uncharacterized membrane protein YeaQ/YmgE (transglycosylase-associated protein family)
VIFGWIGAWLGSPVFGYWFEGVKYENVYIIPAIMGSVALLIIMIDFVNTLKSAATQ